VQSTRTTTLPSQTVRTIPSQVVSVAANRITSPPASRVTVTNRQTGSVASFPAAATVARAGTTQVTRVISTETPVANSLPGSALMSGKTGGSPVVCSQRAPKVVSGTPTLVVSTTTVCGTKVVLSPQVSIAGKTTTMLTGSVEYGGRQWPSKVKNTKSTQKSKVDLRTKMSL